MVKKSWLDKFIDKHPKISEFIWGPKCPKCGTLMQEHGGDYVRCLSCKKKVKK